MLRVLSRLMRGWGTPLVVFCLQASLSAQEAATATAAPVTAAAADSLSTLQQQAIQDGKSPLAWWGTDPSVYVGWSNHSNRLIPVYTFGTGNVPAGIGLNLQDYIDSNSAYRSAEKLRMIYGYVPESTVSSDATWMDQTNIEDLQLAAVMTGRKYVFLVVFDGMDWQTTQAAAIWNRGDTTYTSGRGDGTHFQQYTAGGTSQFGYMVTSPHNTGTKVSADAQTVENPGGTLRGGYDSRLAGSAPWAVPADMGYLISEPKDGNIKHAFTDSASSATSMTAGIKTYNAAINVDATGAPVATVAHLLQEAGWRVGVVSSVPVSHATPAAAYAHNVTRNDYQDLTRDLIGLPSVQHPEHPLPGVDLLIGGGFGKTLEEENGIKNQGSNFVVGNMYLTAADLQASQVEHGGRYVTAVRTSGRAGAELLEEATTQAIDGNHRLLGFFGVGEYDGHLPFQTADGHGPAAPGKSGTAETYTPADISENPTLAQMTTSALRYLDRNERPFWLMVECGDVDWANHDNNIDNSVGAVNSGDDAVRVITSWVEQHSNWEESVLIVTADHGHLMNLADPGLLANAAKSSRKPADASAPQE